MNETAAAKVLIVGAGAMGLITGYILSQGGAEVTYLVRPNREQQLSRPQKLYSYDDHSLKTFDAYDVITSASGIERGHYDFIVLTLDGTALRSDEGQALVGAIGDAARGTETKVLIGTIGINLKPAFLKTSGLAEDQVFSGGLFIIAYQVDRVTLPVHPPTDPELLAQADLAYRQGSPMGLFIDDSAPEAAHRFAKLFEASGTSQCVIMSPQAYSTQVPAAFPIFAACDIMGWPSWKVLHTDRELWELAAAAAREIQGLDINGEVGREAQAQTSADGLMQMWRQLEESAFPLDHGAFNRFHHGGKVYQQDVKLLEDCVALGEAEGKPMSALKELIGRVVAAHVPG